MRGRGALTIADPDAQTPARPRQLQNYEHEKDARTWTPKKPYQVSTDALLLLDIQRHPYDDYLRVRGAFRVMGDPRQPAN